VTPRMNTVSRFDGQTGPRGFRLCRQCGKECPSKQRKYCSRPCADLWALENWPSAQRRQVFNRDKGVCTTCGIDAHELGERVRALLLRLRGIGWRSRDVDRIKRTGARLERIVQRYHGRWTFSLSFWQPSSFWEMDHRIPLAEGGSSALDNLRTLCRACHRAETKALAGRLAARRKQA
jgi:5-methylcytosine-specific restriction enzyme A